jgi:hypothetical protein
MDRAGWLTQRRVKGKRKEEGGCLERPKRDPCVGVIEGGIREYGDQGMGSEYLIPGTEFHPLVRGLLKLLGVELIVPLADLAILTGTDCSEDEEVSGAGPVLDQGEAVFSRVKVVCDTGLGTEEYRRWRALDSKQEKTGKEFKECLDV